jgi:hypothetical protein
MSEIFQNINKKEVFLSWHEAKADKSEGERRFGRNKNARKSEENRLKIRLTFGVNSLTETFLMNRSR